MAIDYSLFPYTYIEKLKLTRPDTVFEAYLCISNHPFLDLKEKREQFLHPEELAYFDSLRFERRQKSFLLGRYCAKQAISKYLGDSGEMTQFAIRHGVFEHPIIKNVLNKDVQISISHNDEFGGAIAFPEEHPMAIDLEKINPKRTEVIQTQCTQDELRLIQSSQIPDMTQMTILWTVKESLSKVLKCGLMTPFKVFEVKDLASKSDCFVWTFKKFAQYKAMSFIISNTACSIVMPKNTEMLIHVKELKELFKSK